MCVCVCVKSSGWNRGEDSEMEVNSVKGSSAPYGPLRGCCGPKELLVVACAVDECDFPKNSTVHILPFLLSLSSISLSPFV